MERIFIVNPVAGKGKALNVSKIIEDICKEEEMDYVIHYTKGKEDATEIVKQYTNNLEETIIYSVGGDGTLNEVVNGIANSNKILGIIPAGSGNDFVRSINPTNQKISKIDIGLVNHRYFINYASLGLDAEIAKNAELMKQKHVPTKLIYLASIAYTLSKYKNCQINFNNENKEITILTLCNGRYYGNGIKMAPQAKIDDGLLDVYLIDKLNKLKIMRLLVELLRSNHEKYACVHKFQTDNLEVSSDIPMICGVNGETIIDKEFKFSIIKQGINLITNDHPKIMKLIQKM